MGMFNGFLAGITPVAGVANGVLETVSGVQAFVKEMTFSGEVTTSTAMRTRLARDSAVGTGSRTSGNVQKLSNHSAANTAFFSTTYGTLQPTVVAGAIWGTSWNCHGGVVRYLADPGYRIEIFDAAAANASVEIRQDTGTGTSSYSIAWEES